MKYKQEYLKLQKQLAEETKKLNGKLTAVSKKS